MKTLLITAAAFVLFSETIAAQTLSNDPEYARLVDSAFMHLQKGNCQPCLSFYEKAFQRSRHSALSHLRAALCADWCGDSIKTESLSIQAVLIGWAVCEKVLKEPQNYPEFKRTAGSSFEIGIYQKIRLQAEALGIDFSLRSELEQIHENDQKYRRMSNPYQPGSPEHSAFTEAFVRADSLNLVKIEEILKIYGYPGKSMKLAWSHWRIMLYGLALFGR